MGKRTYCKRKPNDVVNGAVLIERVNSRLWKMKCKVCGKFYTSQPSCTNGLCRECAYKLSARERERHGESPSVGKQASRLYRIWLGMKTRCNNPRNHSYKNYGAKGIKVCPEWNEYLRFKEWAKNSGYSDSLSIDRIDFHGNYEPSNCRWATNSEQMRNTSANHLLEYKGQTKTMAEWADISKIPYHTLKARINRYGFSIEEALTIPVKKGNNQNLRKRTETYDCSEGKNDI